MLYQLQTRGPAIFVCFKLPYPFICCGTDAEVLNLVQHSAVIGIVPSTVERYRVYQPLFIRLGITWCNPYLRLDLADDVFVAYSINTCCTPHIWDKPIITIIPSPSKINCVHLDLIWVGLGAAYLNLQLSHAQDELWLCPEGVYYQILLLLEITHPVYERFYLLMDRNTELVDMAGFLPVLNQHEVLVFACSKQQHILYGNELVGFHKTCSPSCWHARNLEVFL